MTPTKLNRAPLTKRISALAITAAAALSFAMFAPNAQAATPIKPTKEFRALADALAALVPPATIDNATPAQLQQAVQDAFTAHPTYKPGNIAGEALKYAARQDAGDEIAAGLAAANAGDDTLAARDAIRRAGTGKGLNVSLVPDFAAQFVASDPEAYALAKLVISTKPGAGAVIGGRAGELGSDAQRLTLAIGALARANRLTAATTDITKYVVAEVTGDTADFTHDLAVDPANVTLAAKIGTGGVAGDPTNGGEIVDALLSEVNLPKLKSGIASFVKSVGKVADIEEIAKIALAVGEQIGTQSTTKPTTTAIKFASANGVVKSLAKAIVAKATTAAPQNNGTNKEDEIAEVAAGMVAQILNVNTVNGVGGGKPQVTAKNAGPKLLALIKSAVNATKPKKVQTAHSGIYAETAEDVAGSVAETLGSLRDLPGQTIPTAFFDGIIAYLTSKVNSIGGKANAGAVGDALVAGYLAGPSSVYEDGVLAAALILNSDPETDFRNN